MMDPGLAIGLGVLAICIILWIGLGLGHRDHNWLYYGDTVRGCLNCPLFETQTEDGKWHHQH